MQKSCRGSSKINKPSWSFWRRNRKRRRSSDAQEDRSTNEAGREGHGVRGGRSGSGNGAGAGGAEVQQGGDRQGGAHGCCDAESNRASRKARRNLPGTSGSVAVPLDKPEDRKVSKRVNLRSTQSSAGKQCPRGGALRRGEDPRSQSQDQLPKRQADKGAITRATGPDREAKDGSCRSKQGEERPTRETPGARKENEHSSDGRLGRYRGSGPECRSRGTLQQDDHLQHGGHPGAKKPCQTKSTNFGWCSSPPTLCTGVRLAAYQ